MINLYNWPCKLSKSRIFRGRKESFQSVVIQITILYYYKIYLLLQHLISAISSLHNPDNIPVLLLVITDNTLLQLCFPSSRPFTQNKLIKTPVINISGTIYHNEIRKYQLCLYLYWYDIENNTYCIPTGLSS